MAIFRNVVFIAAIAGLLAGIGMTAMQSWATVPLILQAESFESAGGGHDHAAPTTGDATAPAVHQQEAVAPAVHEHDAEAWAPADGVERFAFTALANIVTGVGFALVLVAASELAGGIRTWRAGFVWGFAGFAIFTLAPGLGLPPELPAMPAADLVARQVWWIGTAASTAAGLALIAFRGTAIASLVGAALLVAPHLIGAPQPDDYASPIPEALHHNFVVAATVTNLLFWLLLGAAVGAVRSRLMRSADGLASSLA